ncbi:hypothetical protein [Klebsiella pneumoniae]|nr:hypothetical protein [Klebsiella pneumoniae]EMA6998315.1 hypothetical protein [Shigella sonnei]MDK9893768.1 hypothetical protein [Klebsiella pneumoniae]
MKKIVLTAGVVIVVMGFVGMLFLVSDGKPIESAQPVAVDAGKGASQK